MLIFPFKSLFLIWLIIIRYYEDIVHALCNLINSKLPPQEILKPLRDERQEILWRFSLFLTQSLRWLVTTGENTDGGSHRLCNQSITASWCFFAFIFCQLKWNIPPRSVTEIAFRKDYFIFLSHHFSVTD